MKELAVITQDGIFPPGTPAPAGVYPEERIAVRAIIFDEEGKVAINHYPLKKEWDEEWYMPGGGVEAGEDLVSALRREVKEEVGCELKNIEELGLLRRYFVEEGKIGLDYCYIAEVSGEKGTAQLLERDKEHGLEPIWAYPDDVISKINLITVDGIGSQKYRSRMLAMRHTSVFLLNLAKNRSIKKQLF